MVLWHVFHKKNKSWTIQTAGIVAASIGVFVAKMIEKFAEQEEPANAAGVTIKYVLFPALTPYVMRLTTSVLQSSNIGYVFAGFHIFAHMQTGLEVCISHNNA